jgi:hypothetical protein
MTLLCDLARKWGTDKALFYTPFYDSLFCGRREQVHKMMELGIGYPETMLESVARMGLSTYTAGASLFMWEEYFPNAEIVGLDNKPELLINRGRIHSFFVDQKTPETFDGLGEDFDLIIEDGEHTLDCQLASAMKLVPRLADCGIYIIEDVGGWHAELRAVLPWPSYLKDFGDARIIVVDP